MSLPKHRARAVEAMARQLCETRFTDGFCCVQDGKCQGPGVERRPDRNCMMVADGLLRAMETRGMSVVWDHDPANHPDPITNAAELAAIGEIFTDDQRAKHRAQDALYEETMKTP